MVVQGWLLRVQKQSNGVMVSEHAAATGKVLEAALCSEGPPFELYACASRQSGCVRASLLWTIAALCSSSRLLGDDGRAKLRLDGVGFAGIVAMFSAANNTKEVIEAMVAIGSCQLSGRGGGGGGGAGAGAGAGGGGTGAESSAIPNSPLRESTSQPYSRQPYSTVESASPARSRGSFGSDGGGDGADPDVLTSHPEYLSPNRDGGGESEQDGVQDRSVSPIYIYMLKNNTLSNHQG